MFLVVLISKQPLVILESLKEDSNDQIPKE